MEIHKAGFTNNTTHPHNTWLREGVQAGDVRTSVVDLNNNIDYIQYDTAKDNNVLDKWQSTPFVNNFAKYILF